MKMINKIFGKHTARKFGLNRLLLVFALAAMFIVQTVSAQVFKPIGGGTIVTVSGNVQADGANLADAIVLLTNLQGVVVFDAMTDANGNYIANAVAGNSYTVSVYKSGYNFNPAYQTFNNLQSNQTADFQNGVMLCIPAPAGQSGGNYCQDASGTAISPVQNGKIAFVNLAYIFSMDADGGNRTQLSDGGFPAWSPDGSKIVFNRKPDFENDDEIFTMNADGSNRTQITFNNFTDFQPRWSPDGRRIVFVRYVNYNNEIFTMKADGTDERQLTDNEFTDNFPSYSPDGSQIAFASDRVNGGGTSEIFKMNSADGSSQTRLTFDDELTLNYYPFWSPDSANIVFRSNRDGGDDELFFVNADSAVLTQLTDDTDEESEPTISPDGTHLLFSRPPTPNDLFDLYTLRLVTGSPQIQITDTASVNEEYASWQPVVGSVAVALGGNININFSHATGAGNTTATPIPLASAGALPTGFYLTGDSAAYDVRTSATFAGSVDVCFDLPNAGDQNAFNNLRILHNEDGVLIDRTSSRDFAARRICATVTSLSPFIVTSAAVPTAASVIVSGRVLTPSGRGLMNATVLLTDATGATRSTRTTTFGYYRFNEVAAGQTYIFNVRSKRFQFVPRVVSITEEIDDLNFIAAF
ncbi:MAG: carboxypeptidase regulatory-like domain-containing protein [Pyrinomonadaceae bacterium]